LSPPQALYLPQLQEIWVYDETLGGYLQMGDWPQAVSQTQSLPERIHSQDA
jgi:hypothetical protein